MLFRRTQESPAYGNRRGNLLFWIKQNTVRSSVGAHSDNLTRVWFTPPKLVAEWVKRKAICARVAAAGPGTLVEGERPWKRHLNHPLGRTVSRRSA